jgi:hypothetical protein
VTPAERALLLVIEAQRAMLKAQYRLLPGTTQYDAMAKLDEAAELLKS